MLLSGSSDCSIIVWKKSDEGSWGVCAELKGHTSSVTCIASVTKNDQVFVMSTSADGTVRVWCGSLAGGEWTCIQVIEFGNNYQQAVCGSVLPVHDIPVFVTGGVDKRLHVYSLGGAEFIECASLQGHADWISGAAFSLWEDHLLLASSGQDKYVRLWNFRFVGENEKCLDEVDVALKKNILDDDLEGGDLFGMTSGLHVKKNTLKNVRSCSGELLHYTVSIESILEGHDDWVYGLSWVPKTKGENGDILQEEKLLTSSMDKTMMIWSPDEESGVWLNDVSVGEFGGTNMGLFGGVFGPAGEYVLGHGYQGALHMWKRDKVAAGDERNARWEACSAVSGHFLNVCDISWDPTFTYLLSGSLDQTSRLHGEWKAGSRALGAPSWHEIARPQIHGHDIFCVDFINSTKFASGAEEKVVRTFEGTENFVESVKTICESTSCAPEDGSLPLGASVPALGLSNKAVFKGEAGAHEDESSTAVSDPFGDENLPCNVFSARTLQSPPLEEHLMQNSLWPEAQKLYGHGYELVCVAGSHDGSVLATASRATSAEHAAVRLWNTETNQEVCSPLQIHTLTVTQMVFSHNDKWLVTVSRDRHWAMFRREDDANGTTGARPYVLHSKCKAHERILWSASWSHDDKYFATVSRDKKLKIWSQSVEEGSCDGPWQLCFELPKQHESITAVDFAPHLTSDGRYIVALGFDDGTLKFVQSAPANRCQANISFSPFFDVDPSLCHAATVRRALWRREEETNDSMLLATCSNDHSVRLYRVHCK